MNYRNDTEAFEELPVSGSEFAAVLAQSRPYPRRKKKNADSVLVREIGSLMALVVGITFFVLSYM